MADSSLYIGLISGTSVDGIDCALVEFSKQPPRLIDALCLPLDDSLRTAVLQLCTGDPYPVQLLGETHIALGRQFAAAVAELLQRTGTAADDIAAIGSHGQTVWHQPGLENPFTLQLGDPNTIAQRTGITTVADLRSMDIAAGGQGAPLAPLLHREIFYSTDVDRAIINIGGISNITLLPRSGAALAFDSGPGNVLMDYWAEKHLGQRYDKDGNWAAGGQFNLTLLNALLQEDYFSRQPPKSTGRELFNGPWLEAKLNGLAAEIDARDVQATLLTFTVTTLISALNRQFSAQEIYVCGGGAHNQTLMQELGKVAADYSVSPTTSIGIDPDWVEAMAFAWMARETLAGRHIDTGAFTGASRPVILGGIYRP